MPIASPSKGAVNNQICGVSHNWRAKHEHWIYLSVGGLIYNITLFSKQLLLVLWISNMQFCASSINNTSHRQPSAHAMMVKNPHLTSYPGIRLVPSTHEYCIYGAGHKTIIIMNMHKQPPLSPNWLYVWSVIVTFWM